MTKEELIDQLARDMENKEMSKIIIPVEFGDIRKVLQHGAKKYGANSWIAGKHFNHRDNHMSMFRHLAESYMGTREDWESGLDPLLHLACRALMEYYILGKGK